MEFLRFFCFGASGFLAANSTYGADWTAIKEVPDRVVSRSTSRVDVYERSAAYKEKFVAREEEIERLKAENDALRKSGASARDIEELRESLRPAGAPSHEPLSANLKGLATEPSPVPPPPTERPPKSTSTPSVAKTVIRPPLGSNLGPRRLLVFETAAQSSEFFGDATVVPVGAYVKARVLTGVEASAQGEPIPMLLQADYAFEGPNQRQIDMTGCFFVVKAKGNLSTERVTGEGVKISCVRNSGEAVNRPISAYLVGEDSTFGAAGQLISKQGQVFMAAVLSNLAKSVGEAVAIANSKSMVAITAQGTGDKTTSVDKVDRGAYVAGQSVAGAAEIITQWYLKQAQSLVPSIAVGSGRDVWLVMLDQVLIPPLAEREF